MKLVYFHGEVAIISGGLRPKTAKKLEPKDNHYILANSETTGNHHVLEAIDGVDVYEQDGVLYLHVEDEARVSCVLKERHDTQILPAGDYIVKRKLEYDHLTNTPRVVAD